MFQKVLKKLSGLPDMAMTGFASILPRKNSASYAEYLKSLSFYKEFDESKPFFVLPDDAPSMNEVECEVENGIKRRVLSFASRYEVRNPDVSDEFYGYKQNLSGYLHLWQSEKEKRPLVLCVHGFMMGDVKLAEKMFRISKMVDLGVDVGVFVLPHHGLRTPNTMKQRILAPENIPLTVETFGQCMHDLHGVMLWLKEQGHDRIGLIGASLGGYCSALYSSMKKLHEFLFMVVPAVNFQTHFVPKKRYFSFTPDSQIKSLTEKALGLVTPENYPPLLNADDISIVMHSDDRMNYPEFTRTFAKKWGVKNVVEVEGGHWIHFDQKARGRSWYKWLNEKGFTS